MKKSLTLGAAAAAVLAATSVAHATTVNQAVTEAEVLAAQQAWCNALVQISQTHRDKGVEAARALAEQVIDEVDGVGASKVHDRITLRAGRSRRRRPARRA